MPMKSRAYLAIVGLLLTLLVVGVTSPVANAQGNNQPRNCPQLVRVAEEELVLNCANLPFNTACYGYPEVAAPFDDQPDMLDPDFVPGSWTPLQSYAGVMTSAMSVPDAEWGLAALNVQADVPRGLLEELGTDPGVLFLLFGNVAVENAVPAELEYLPVETPLAVTTIADTDARANPNAAAETLGAVMADTTLFADGISPDGAWLRVAYEMQAAWVAVADVAEVDVTGLPVIGPDSLTPYQSFYLRNGNAPMQCNQAVPDMIFMQMPRDVTADVIIDGVPVRLESATVVARILPGDVLRFDVIGGLITIYPDSPNAVIVPAGFAYDACTLTPPDQINGHDGEPNDQIADCEGGLPRPITNQERQMLQSLEGMPDNLFNDDVRIPRVRRGSGVGGPQDEVILDPTSPAYDVIVANCDEGKIPAEICSLLVGYTPGE